MKKNKNNVLITVKPVLRGHLWDKEKVAYKTGDLGFNSYEISVVGQE
jgi:hypothetical protein